MALRPSVHGSATAGRSAQGWSWAALNPSAACLPVNSIRSAAEPRTSRPSKRLRISPAIARPARVQRVQILQEIRPLVFHKTYAITYKRYNALEQLANDQRPRDSTARRAHGGRLARLHGIADTALCSLVTDERRVPCALSDDAVRVALGGSVKPARNQKHG